jgi:hypothetical protein
VLPPLTGEAVKFTSVFGQIAPAGKAETLTDGVTCGVTVIVTGAEVAVDGETQVSFEVITTVTTSPFARLELVNEEPVPAFTPFTFHWYVGDGPPLTAVAVKFTGVPGQIAPAGFTAILTDGVSNGLTLMVSELFATNGEAQVAFDVSVTLTISLFVSDEELYVALLLPAFTPFTFHW